MFEHVPHIQSAFASEAVTLSSPASAPGGEASARAGDALRAIGWSELAARINAARDLRAELQRETSKGSVSVASFGDAAANYFATRDEGERAVNPFALEARKVRAVINPETKDAAAEGDREITND